MLNKIEMDLQVIDEGNSKTSKQEAKQKTINQSYNMANNNALATTLALASSKTNWTAIVPARAAPPPPPTEQYVVGQCECCECDVTADQEYLKLKTGAGAGRIYCEEHVGWGECQKAWSASCGCDVCADKEEEEEYICDCSVCGERLYACGSVELAEDADGGGCCAGCAPKAEEEKPDFIATLVASVTADAKKEEKLQDEFWNGGMSEMWGSALREGHPLWEPYKLYKAMKKEQDEEC